MTIYGRKDLNWTEKKNIYELYFKETLMFKIVPSDYPKMYYVVWADGRKSSHPYNLERAKEHCFGLSLSKLNTGEERSEIEYARNRTP